ncbi:MAG: hypothetical protein LBE91_19545, partial [Tannerella sp.]|nr:hypothetical protein [Tannerella sp.]
KCVICSGGDMIPYVSICVRHVVSEKDYSGAKITIISQNARICKIFFILGGKLYNFYLLSRFRILLRSSQ